MPKIDATRPFIPVTIAVLTISDSRKEEDDFSGKTLAAHLEDAGHSLADKIIVHDDIHAIQKQIKAWVDKGTADVIITTGGTGLTGRDVTPEALEPLFTKAIPGFGELFRMLSYNTIGTSTIQSRALAGLIGSTLVFALPGSTGACKDAWDNILVTQLDNRYRPCNFVEMMPRYSET